MTGAAATTSAPAFASGLLPATPNQLATQHRLKQRLLHEAIAQTKQIAAGAA